MSYTQRRPASGTPFIDWLRICRLGSPGRSADLLLQRYQRNVGIDVLRKDAGVQVTVAA